MSALVKKVPSWAYLATGFALLMIIGIAVS